MNVRVVGVFDNMRLAEQARQALLSAGVIELRIAVELGEDGLFRVGVHAQSSFEQARITELLQHHGASRTEKRPAFGAQGDP